MARVKKLPKGIRKSKSEDFLKRFSEDQSMVEYLTELRIMNPAAEIKKGLNTPRREGAFVRLAHAREEFTAPVITKGKSVQKAVRRNSTSKRKQR